MEDITRTLALTSGAGWASGINLYAAVLLLGVLRLTGRMELPEGLQARSDPLVMFAAGAMHLVAFLLLLVWRMPKPWRGIKRLSGSPGRLLRRGGLAPDPQERPPAASPEGRKSG